MKNVMQSLLNYFLGRYWEMVQRLKITHFYTAPTAIRMLIKCGEEWVHKYDRSTLRILGCGKLLNLFLHAI
jgi:acetyl-CoA synthetase